MDEKLEKKIKFYLRYAFQTTIHALWRERNKIRHEEKPIPVAAVIKMVDKGIRNKLSLVRAKEVKGWEEVLQFWFSTRL